MVLGRQAPGTPDGAVSEGSELDGALAAPRADEAARSDTFWVRGWVAAKYQAIVKVTVQRAGALDRRLLHGLAWVDESGQARADGFAGPVPLGRAPRGSLAFTVRVTLFDGRELDAFSGRVFVDRPAVPRPSAVEAAGLLVAAARKAGRAFAEGRLPLSPRRWARDLRLHFEEWRAARLRARKDAGQVDAGDARAALTALATRELDAFLTEGARLDLTPRAEPRVSVIVVVYNRAELTLRCLRALARETVPFELVLVDNASTDATPQLLARLDGARLVRSEENAGFVRAVNRAAKEARAEYLLLLNNDAELAPGALAAAVERAGGPDAPGAVGARLILPDGRLQEAGSIIWRDGVCEAYGRGDSPFSPEYEFARDVDFVSGAFLLTPRALFAELSGFDERYAPAYYEDADYCARLWQRGRRVVYEPRATVHHFEFASSRSPEAATRMQAERRARFASAQGTWLEGQPVRGERTVLEARMHGRPRRVLFIDDRVPDRLHGSGHPRARDLLDALSASGAFVTVFPTLFGGGETPGPAPDRVEVLSGGAPRLGDLLDARECYYDDILVSRPHNLRRLRALGRARARVIYDAEAIFALREAGRRSLGGEPIPNAELERLIADEVALARGADLVLAVSDAERERFQAAGIAHAVTLGHALPTAPTPRPFAAREGLLFVGAFYEDESPNSDSMFWFVRDVLPRVRARLGHAVGLTIAGARPTRRIEALAATPGVEVLGRVDELAPLYDHARLFVAPTRFSAGLPYKVHHAAAHGLPVVATTRLASELGWTSGVELATADGADAFADACVRLYGDAEAWSRLRGAALGRVEHDCSPRAFTAALLRALA